MSDMYYFGVRIDDVHPTAGSRLADQLIGHAMMVLYGPGGEELSVTGFMPEDNYFEFMNSI